MNEIPLSVTLKERDITKIQYNRFYNFVFDLYVVRLLVFWKNVLNVSIFYKKMHQYEIKAFYFHFSSDFVFDL